MPVMTNDDDCINKNPAIPFDADEEMAALKERVAALEKRLDALAGAALVVDNQNTGKGQEK